MTTLEPPLGAASLSPRGLKHALTLAGIATPRGVHDRIGGGKKTVGQVVVPRKRNVDLPFSGGR